jgi:Protein of unknown function (DUF4058)
MPLRDHFHSPVNDKHHWSSFHGGWPMEIVRTLFDLLPPGYQAGPRVYLGSSFEVDVSVAGDDDRPPDGTDDGAGGTATLTAADPPFTIVTDLRGVDEYEVRVYEAGREQTLVAAVEIVSPSNKDRPDHRLQFAGKVAALLREGVCVSVVDIVTDRQANLYAELLAAIDQADPRLGDPPPAVYAVTLRRRRPKKKPPRLDVWYFPLALGQPLPIIPLWLSPTLRIDLPLEASYQEVCRLLRIA